MEGDLGYMQALEAEINTQLTVCKMSWLKPWELVTRSKHYLLGINNGKKCPRWMLSDGAYFFAMKDTLNCIAYLKTLEGKKKAISLFGACKWMRGHQSSGCVWAMLDLAAMMDEDLKLGLRRDAVCDSKGVLWSLSCGTALGEGRGLSYAAKEDPRSEYTFGSIAREMLVFHEKLERMTTLSLVDDANCKPRVTGCLKLAQLCVMEECLARIRQGVDVDRTVPLWILSKKAGQEEDSSSAVCPAADLSTEFQVDRETGCQKRKCAPDGSHDGAPFKRQAAPERITIHRDCDYTADELERALKPDTAAQMSKLDCIKQVKDALFYLMTHTVQETIDFATEARKTQVARRKAPHLCPRILNFRSGLRSLLWSSARREMEFALLPGGVGSEDTYYRLCDAVPFTKKDLPLQAVVRTLPRFWMDEGPVAGCYPTVALSGEWQPAQISDNRNEGSSFGPDSPHVSPGVMRPQKSVEVSRPRSRGVLSTRPHSLTVMQRISKLNGVGAGERESYASAWTWSSKNTGLHAILFPVIRPSEARSCDDDELKKLLEGLKESHMSSLSSESGLDS
jgi:hypothetical protein